MNCYSLLEENYISFLVEGRIGLTLFPIQLPIQLVILPCQAFRRQEFKGKRALCQIYQPLKKFNALLEPTKLMKNIVRQTH